MATVNSRFELVDIANLTTAAEIQTKVNLGIETLEAAGFVVTERHVQPPHVYLLGVLGSHLSQSFETTEDLWIPPSDIVVVGGTWTLILDGNGVPIKSRAAADATGTITVPIVIPGSRSDASRGHKLNYVQIAYTLATAAADAVSAITLTSFTPVDAAVATNGDPVLGAIVSTMDAAHDAAGERLTLGDHSARATVTTPAYRGARVQYQADFTFDAAATTVLTVYGALANYTYQR